MASARPVRDSDTALWLHNKLGSIEEFWVSSSIGGIIKTDTIDNILRCFPVLSNAVKMKLLLGILHLPRRSLDEMKHTMGGVIELALEDMDQWIGIVSNIVKHYPITCKLNLDMTTNPIVANIMKQLHEKFKASDASAMLPLECQYLNKNALMIMIGNQPPPQRHFALKRKPKSAALRVDLMQKSTDVSSHAKRSVVSGVMNKQTVPVKHRDMTRKFSDDSSSVKDSHKGFGAPRSQLSTNSPLINRGTSRFSGRMERGTKLLDISEQPVGIKETKRRRKQLQEEQSSQASNESKVPSTPTPEYAAGLVYPSSSGQSQAEVHSENYPAEQETESQEEDLSIDKEEEGTNDDSDGMTSDTPNTEYNDNKNKKGSENASYVSNNLPEKSITYEMPATPSPFFNSNSALDNPAVDSRIAYSHSARSVSSVQVSPQAPQPPPKQNVPNPLSSPGETRPQKAVSNSYASVMPSYGATNPRTGPSLTPSGTSHLYSANFQTAANQQALPITPTRNPTTSKIQQYTHVYQPPSYVALPGARPYMTTEKRPQGNSSHHPLAVHQLATPAYQGAKVGSAPQQSNNPSHSHTPQQTPSEQLQQQQKMKPPQKALTLTKEQMFQAQELFRSAPCLTRQEKAIILGFWAGSRENPSPEKGDVLQIVLSQHEQSVQNPVNGELVPVIVETIFEMNYATGMAVKKQRVKQIGSSAHGKT